MTQEENCVALVSTFYLGDALFGISTIEMQEVVQLGDLTPVHHAPGYISGIINLRGQIVTVIDLAIKLEILRDDDRLPQYIVIVFWKDEAVGLLVDSMGEVIEVDDGNLSPVPANIRSAQQKYIKGIHPTGIRPVAVLDIDAVLGMEENEASSFSSG
jgi:purine-binding chemotaxis protein CheW